MVKIFRSEFLKMKKSTIWLLIFISPILASLTIAFGDQEDWSYAYAIMTLVHAVLFLPLLTGVFSAFVCRFEHIGGGWKQLLALPVSRRNVYIVKLLIVFGLLAITQILFLLGLMLVGHVRHYSGDIPWEMILKGLIGGWIACMPLAALQLYVSVAWSSFAAPLAVNVIFTLPNILIVNSEKYAPFYPWAQPFLAMTPSSGGEGIMNFNVSSETLFIVIIGGFLLFFLSGLVYFQRKEI
ncbi:ABC transporter permease [Bacillus sp. 03113]|uniref:ABC transporter permease n=1 Tax=Bacillus sp. 03113 TaxID=2578211 RepID=UPI0011447379|nr:ABC transporter permease [Bacillus sp. 03113]